MNGNYLSLITELENCRIEKENEAYIRDLCHFIMNTRFNNKRKKQYAISLCREKLNGLERNLIYSSGDIFTPYYAYDLTQIICNTLSAAKAMLPQSKLQISFTFPCSVFILCTEKLIIRAVCEILRSHIQDGGGKIKFVVDNFKSYSLLSVKYYEVKHCDLTYSDISLHSILSKITEVHSGAAMFKISNKQKEIYMTFKKQDTNSVRRNAMSAGEILSNKFSTPYLVLKPEKF